MVNSVRPSVVGLKLMNVYDINSRVYILKFQRSGFKCFLLVESGVRFHLTEYQRDKSSVPSNFTMKLRKHIRTRRLQSIEQLGADRCVMLTFGWGENTFHLILELFVSGNLILTDHEHKILALLRTHQTHQEKVAMRQVYRVSFARGLLTTPIDQFQKAIEDLLEQAGARQENQELKEMDQDDEKAKEATKKGKDSAFVKRSKKRVMHAALPLVQILHKLAPFTDPQLCSACITRVMEADGRECVNAFKITVDDFPSLEEVVATVQQAAEAALETMRSVSRPEDLGGGNLARLEAHPEGEEADVALDDDDDDDVPPGQGDAGASKVPKPSLEPEAPIIPGWIVRKQIHVPASESRWANEDFTPLPPEQLNGDDADEAVVPYETFHRCVDEFFSQIEENKAIEQRAQHAQSVQNRLDQIRTDQNRRLEALEAEQEAAERQALLIEDNVELVDRALVMLNAMIASQVDWGELWREVKRQQALGHPIAQHIHSLDLERNEFKLLLSPKEDEEDAEMEDKPMEVVPLDLSLSSHANVARLHAKRKETRDKTSRTLTKVEAAIKIAEKRAQQDIQKFQRKQTIRKVRTGWWFEKFIWFISSENYLVLAGHDERQEEMIFCKHMGPQDVFVYADVAKARPCFIRNPKGGEVPPATLREAGTLTLCHSMAWEKNLVISAWWAQADHVTCGAPQEGAESSAFGNFFVRGRRHWMPPLHVEMGFTLLFGLAEGSVARHKGERRSRYLEVMAATGGAGVTAEEEEELPELESVEDEAEGAGRAEALKEEGEVAAAAQEENEEPKDEEVEEDEPDTETAATSGAAEDSTAAETSARGGHSKISAAERRRQKKGGDGEGAAGDSEGVRGTGSGAGSGKERFEPPQRAQGPSKGGVDRQPATPSKGPAPLPRGQKAKAKKIKEKYADQDEEDRELRLALLGSKSTKRAQCASATPTAEPEKVTSPAAELEEEPVAAPPPAAEGRRPPKPKLPPAPAVALSVGCEVEPGAAEVQASLDFDVLTGHPTPEDEVLYIMPMVAPYCALGGPYSFRVKLTPGPTKKGPAVKQCLKVFETQIDRVAWKQLLQAVSEQEAAGLMCGNCKLSMPGLMKIQALAKKEKKKEMKEQERTGEGKK